MHVRLIDFVTGGYTSADKDVIELLRQQSRPYVFSNSLSPMIVGASTKALEILNEDNSLVQKLQDNTQVSIFRIHFQVCIIYLM